MSTENMEFSEKVLVERYAEMAQDIEREREAIEWSEGLIRDVIDVNVE